MNYLKLNGTYINLDNFISMDVDKNTGALKMWAVNGDKYTYTDKKQVATIISAITNKGK